jgi:hypothetical protein
MATKSTPALLTVITAASLGLCGDPTEPTEWLLPAGQPGNWNTPENWSLGIPEGSSNCNDRHPPIIGNGGEVLKTSSAPPTNSTVFTTVDIKNGSILRLSESGTLYLNGCPGNLRVQSGGTLELRDSSLLKGGFHALNDSTLILEGTPTIDGWGLYAERSSVSISGTVTIIGPDFGVQFIRNSTLVMQGQNLGTPFVIHGPVSLGPSTILTAIEVGGGPLNISGASLVASGNVEPTECHLEDGSYIEARAFYAPIVTTSGNATMYIREYMELGYSHLPDSLSLTLGGNARLQWAENNPGNQPRQIGALRALGNLALAGYPLPEPFLLSIATPMFSVITPSVISTDEGFPIEIQSSRLVVDGLDISRTLTPGQLLDSSTTTWLAPGVTFRYLPQPCSPADLDAPFGVLDLYDAYAFVSAFLIGDPAADLTGDGIFDLRDIGLFIDAINAGC